MKRQLTVAALAMMLVASACGGDDDAGDSSAPDVQATTPTTAAPVRGGTLVMAISSDPMNLNPAVTSQGGVHTSAEPMFNGLVGWGTDGKIAPELAERWEVQSNGAVYRFTLRTGVKWHDGRDFTADDVKFSFDKALLPLHSRTKASMQSAGLQVNVIDARTVEFRFPNPYAPLLQQLNVTEAPIIPKHVFEGCADIGTVAGCPANRAPIGTGPFKLDSYTPTEIRMSRNPNYFRAGLPYLDALVQRVIPDVGTQILALESGEIDYVGSVPGADIARVKANNKIVTAPAVRSSGGGNCVTTVIFNMRPPAGRTPIFTDLRMRQAVWAAVDRQQAFQQVYFGQGRSATAPIHQGIPVAAAPNLNLPGKDLNRARSLLDAVGWKVESGKDVRVARGVPNVPDGTELNINYIGFVNEQTTYGEILRAQLKEVGFNVTVKTSGNTVLPVEVFTDRAFDTAAASYCNGDDPEVGVRRQIDSRQIGPVGFSNGAGYSNPQVDTLLDQASRETDPPKRTALYRQIQEILVQDLPYMWLAETVNLRGVNANCTGFNHENTGLFAEAVSCRK